MIRKILLEGISPETLYTNKYSQIDKDIFNNIIYCDPTTTETSVGNNATAFLLPCYVKKHDDFLTTIGADVVKDYLQRFIEEQSTYTPKYKNITRFKTVQEFIDFMDNPPNDLYGGSLTSDPIVTFYDKYKQKFESLFTTAEQAKDIFYQLIKLDPITDIDRKIIGNIAKNLIIPLTANGDTSLTENKITPLNFIDICDDYYQLLGANKLPNNFNLSKINSIQDFYEQVFFIQYNCTPEEFAKSSTIVNNNINYTELSDEDDSATDLYKFIISQPDWGSHVKYLGHTKVYDIYRPLTVVGNAWIAGADKKFGGPGWTTQNGSDYYTKNAFGHWCSTSLHSWGAYNNDNLTNYDFILRNNPKKDERKHNFQITVTNDGEIPFAATGEENFHDPALRFKELLAEDKDLLDFFAGCTTEPPLQNLPEVRDNLTNSLKQKVSKNIFIYPSDCDKYANNAFEDYSSYITKICFEGNLSEIPTRICAGNPNLQKVFLAEGIEYIGIEAFKNCIQLKYISKLPKSLKRIGAGSFMNCNTLSGNLIIPTTLSRIDEMAFKNTNVSLQIEAPRNIPLRVAKTDERWFMQHAKNVSAPIKENLTEQFILNENIPKQLAAAYNSNGYRAQHTEIYDIDLDSDTDLIDFGNVKYKEFTKQQTFDFLGIDESGIGNRWLDIVSLVPFLRFVWKGHAYWYNNNGNTSRLSAGTLAFNSDFPSELKNKKMLIKCIQTADTIFWTDENDPKYHYTLNDLNDTTKPFKTDLVQRQFDRYQRKKDIPRIKNIRQVLSSSIDTLQQIIDDYYSHHGTYEGAEEYSDYLERISKENKEVDDVVKDINILKTLYNITMSNSNYLCFFNFGLNAPRNNNQSNARYSQELQSVRNLRNWQQQFNRYKNNRQAYSEDEWSAIEEYFTDIITDKKKEVEKDKVDLRNNSDSVRKTAGAEFLSNTTYKKLIDIFNKRYRIAAIQRTRRRLQRELATLQSNASVLDYIKVDDESVNVLQQLISNLQQQLSEIDSALSNINNTDEQLDAKLTHVKKQLDALLSVEDNTEEDEVVGVAKTKLNNLTQQKDDIVQQQKQTQSERDNIIKSLNRANNDLQHPCDAASRTYAQIINTTEDSLAEMEELLQNANKAEDEAEKEWDDKLRKIKKLPDDPDTDKKDSNINVQSKNLSSNKDTTPKELIGVSFEENLKK